MINKIILLLMGASCRNSKNYKERYDSDTNNGGNSRAPTHKKGELYMPMAEPGYDPFSCNNLYKKDGTLNIKPRFRIGAIYMDL